MNWTPPRRITPFVRRRFRWLYDEVLSWIAGLPANGEADWVFPSERQSTPLAKDNAWRRNMKQKLEGVELSWVNFLVFRRTHATLMRANGVDPKLVADNMGHTLDVNQNVYTQSSLMQRIAAVDTLAAGVYINERNGAFWSRP